VQTVSKGKLKGKMLEYFRQVEQTGDPLIVTDRGVAVLEIRPVKARTDGAEALVRVRAALFGAGKAPPVREQDLMATEWAEPDEAADAWWTPPAKTSKPKR
jgi:antitoxin (DNA-binding transcriptional repressor) of toxin-antitoxin stability system